MARTEGHPVRIRARIARVVDGATRRLGEVERAGDPVRTPDADDGHSAVTPSILVPDGTVLATRRSRHPAVVGAQVGVPSA